MRSFVAFELTDAGRDRLLEAASEVRRLAPAWAGEKWVAPEALHVTVKFLGDLEADRLDSLTELLSERLAGLAPVSIGLDSLCPAPSHGRASMIWAVPSAEDPGVAEVAAAVDGAAAALGVDPDQRTFKTHVTLVRARRPRRIAGDVLETAGAALRASRHDRGKAPFDSVSGSGITVFTSTLTRSGPVYEMWSRVQLGRA